ncbi:argininosuccinate lyase [Ancylobacter sp. G4_0304]|uniref:argininosuccinate lyase n=1 Tax=Ancylobacter sp. G4_0304 TaxID=3114289 RepID=UPI0039C74C7E
MNHETVSLRERVKLPPDPALVEAYYKPAISYGAKYLFPEEMRIHVAHGLMLARQAIVSPSDMVAILKVVAELQAAGPEALDIDYLQEDLYSYSERYIVSRLGADVGGRLHTARSRNDLNVTAWRMVLRRRLLAVAEAVSGLRETCLTLADTHADTIMPGYTHTQHAQPMSLGYYFLAYADVLERDAARLAGALDRCDRCPLGAGALTTTAFPIDRDYTAELLGFPRLVEVAYDAVSARDDAHETVSALAIMMTGLSRVATDLQEWNTLEYGFIELSDAFSSVSSIMPQKKNPQGLEHIKAAAAYVTGALTTVLASSKNTHFADVNDGVTALNASTIDAVDRTMLAVAVARGVFETFAARPDIMLHSAEIGFGTATELADIIVRETGLSFRKAHNIVGWVVREALENKRTALSLTAGDITRASQALFNVPCDLSEETVRRALNPRDNVLARTVQGGPAPANVREMVSRRRTGLAAENQRIRFVRQRLDDADQRLADAVLQLG